MMNSPSIESATFEGRTVAETGAASSMILQQRAVYSLRSAERIAVCMRPRIC